MSVLWIGILITAVGCYLLKLAGLSVPDSVLAKPIVVRTADLIPVALLGALIAVQVFADGKSVVIDARLLGLGVAAVLLSLRVPFLPMVVLSAAAAALLRLLT